MATVKLTERTLAALPPATNHATGCAGSDTCKCALQEYHWDTELTGFGVVVGRTGSKTFVARANVAGKKRRVKIGVAGAPRPDGHTWTVVLARIEARKLLGRMSSGEDPNVGKRATSTPAEKPSTGPTLCEALEFQLANMRAGRNQRRRVCSGRSIYKVDSEVRRHLAEWLDRPLLDLTGPDLQSVCDRIERETPARAGAVNPPGRVQAAKLIGHVSAIWNAADRLHEFPGRNPASRVIPGAIAPRTIRIDDATADRETATSMDFRTWYTNVLAMPSAVRRDLQLVSLFTGVRSDGVRHLRWEDVDEERRLLHIRKAKGDKPYTIPLVETVRAILVERRADNVTRFAPWGGDAGLIFPTLSRLAPFHVIPVANVKEWRTDRSRENADGRPVRVQVVPGVHANRRTFNSVALEIGIPTEARLKLMNHAARGVNERHYSSMQSWDFLRESAERIEAALRERLGMPPIAAPSSHRAQLRAA
jgi:integrase